MIKYVPDCVQTCIKHILTGIDGESYDIAKVCGALGVLFFMGMTAYVVVFKNQPFDYVN